MENNAVTASASNKFEVAVKWGIIVTLVSIVLSLISYRFISSNFFVFSGAVLFIGAVSLVLYATAALNRRKELGGFISFKEAFRVIFIVILISTLLVVTWDVIYPLYIDKGLAPRIKEATIAFMERMKMPQDRIDKAVEEMEKADRQGFTVKTAALNLARVLVIKSIFGMLCALIVQRKLRSPMR